MILRIDQAVDVDQETNPGEGAWTSKHSVAGHTYADSDDPAPEDRRYTLCDGCKLCVTSTYQTSTRGRDVQTRVNMKSLFALVVLFCCSDAIAVDVYANYEERLGESRQLASLEGDAAFGAKIDPAIGSTVFYVPVLTIPGNGGLDITVVYKLGDRNDGSHIWSFEQDEAYIGGTFSSELGWVTKSGDDSRCSNVNTMPYAPPRVDSGKGNGWFQPEEYWSGYQLSLPGGGGSFLNYLGTAPAVPPPTTGGPYKWATNDYWYFSCIPLATGAGTGEGYLGHSPDGLKYYFNAYRTRLADTLYKDDFALGNLDLEREEIRLYAGKIEDRFGNYVSGLSASDGRVVTRAVSGDVVTYTYGSRQWLVKTSPPYTVTYPDGSQWRASFSGSIYDLHSLKQDCLTSPGPGPSPSSMAVTINSPSGATGIYLFKQVTVGYSYVGAQCQQADFSMGSVLVTPSVLLRTSLVQKTISGPGLATSTLAINYGATNDCYTNSNYSPHCVSTSPTTRVVTHTASDGKFKRYTFGNRAYQNADLLLKLEEGASGGLLLRTTEYEYALLPQIGSDAGRSHTSYYFPASSKRVISVARTIKQGGKTFNWRVQSACGASGVDLCVDTFGRPKNVVRSSQP